MSWAVSGGRHAISAFVYILGTETPSGLWRTYVGWTNDLDRRLAAHNRGTGARSTRGRKWILLYVERYDDKRQAMSREWRVKRDRRLRRAVTPGPF